MDALQSPVLSPIFLDDLAELGATESRSDGVKRSKTAAAISAVQICGGSKETLTIHGFPWLRKKRMGEHNYRPSASIFDGDSGFCCYGVRYWQWLPHSARSMTPACAAVGSLGIKSGFEHGKDRTSAPVQPPAPPFSHM